jgi:hypothetical protein
VAAGKAQAVETGSFVRASAANTARGAVGTAVNARDAGVASAAAVSQAPMPAASVGAAVSGNGAVDASYKN